MSRHYINELDPHAAAWLRNLIDAGHLPPGHVDTRSIKDVTPDDVRGYTQCHFFAGIGVWSLALRRAGWPDDRPCGTGSSPCQPFSAAGKQKGKSDDRHLWPPFHNLIVACRDQAWTETVFGEQVSSGEVVGTQLEAAFVAAVHAGDSRRANRLAIKIANHKSNRGFAPEELSSRWLTDLRRDMGAAGYAVRWEVLGSHSIGSPTIRQRLFWGASRVSGPSGQRFDGEPVRGDGRLSGTHCERCRETGLCSRCELDGRRESIGGLFVAENDGASDIAQTGKSDAERTGSTRGIPHASGSGSSKLKRRRNESTRPAASSRFSADYCHWLDFADGKTRPIEPGLECLVDGYPFRLADGSTGRSTQSRAGILKGIGNAIVPQTAAAFIKAFLETEGR